MTSHENRRRSGSGSCWRESSYSGQGGECIEVADHVPGLLPVRDSKDPAGPALLFPSASFSAFVRAVRSGEFGTV
ncbi:DUF397 domain-containing protein [Kitasatospora sp. NPDC051853]|uniref:DUF397 domain-containing protein n=1 Tax=Kitasatospora sp. NPDC051853 TaxID=3364058 RepID=UPI0037873CB2